MFTTGEGTRGAVFAVAILAMLPLCVMGQATHGSADCQMRSPHTGRVGFSNDGNQHDIDDIGASAMVVAIFAAAGADYVHHDYANHLGDNNADAEAKMRESVEGAAQRFYGSTSMTFNDQNNLAGAINNIKNQINASSANDRFHYGLGGPMEVAWRGINASDPSKRQYCVAYSHHVWNDSHVHGEMTHTWDAIKSSGVSTQYLADQNAACGGEGFRAPEASRWDWLRNSTDPDFQFLWSRMVAGSDHDVSDAGIGYAIVTGDMATNVDKLRILLEGGFSSAPPSVTITSPSDGQVLMQPATVGVTASASGKNGKTVSRVDLTNNGNPVGSDDSAPYEWTLRGLMAGNYTLEATAHDSEGKTTKHTISFEVQDPNAIVVKVEAEDYQSMSGIETQETTDAGGGLNVGWIDNGDWMEYSVDIPVAGSYSISFRAASESSGGAIAVKVNGTDAGTATVPGTGGWQTWQTVDGPSGISLSQGTNTVRLECGGGYNLNWIKLQKNEGAVASRTRSGLNGLDGRLVDNGQALVLQNTCGISQAVVYDFNGRMVSRTTIQNGINVVDLRSPAAGRSGAYLLWLIGNDGTVRSHTVVRY